MGSSFHITEMSDGGEDNVKLELVASLCTLAGLHSIRAEQATTNAKGYYKPLDRG
jgi:hypothetical protein